MKKLVTYFLWRNNWSKEVLFKMTQGGFLTYSESFLIFFKKKNLFRASSSSSSFFFCDTCQICRPDFVIHTNLFVEIIKKLIWTKQIKGYILSYIHNIGSFSVSHPKIIVVDFFISKLILYYIFFYCQNFKINVFI